MAIPLQYDIFARDRASDKFDKVGRSMDRANRSSRNFGRGFAVAGAAIGSAAVAAASAVGALGIAGAALGLKMASSLQQAKVSFETLLGSAQRAQAFLNKMTQFAARTPFQTQQVLDYSRALLGAGVSAKNVLPTLTAWGDASGALGQTQEQFGRTMTAVTQIMNKGKVQSEELLQISESGIPIWREMSRALDLPIPVIQSLMKEGKLLSKDVLPALQAQLSKDYGGSMAKQAKTLAGLWSTFKDTLSLGLAQAIQPLVPLLQNALPGAMAKMGSALQSVAGFIAAAIPKIQAFVSSFTNSEGFQGMVGVWKAFIGWIKGALWPVLQSIAADLMPKLQNAWASISETIQNNSGTFAAMGRLLTEVVLPILGKVAGILIDVVGPAFKAVVWVIKQVVIPAFAFLTTAVLFNFRAILNAAAWAFGWIPGIGPKLKKASSDFGAFVDETNAKLMSIVRDIDVNVNIQPVIKPTLDLSQHAEGFIGPTVAEGLAARGIAGPYTPEQTGAAAVAQAKKSAAKAASDAGEAVGGAFAGGIAATGDKIKAAAEKASTAATEAVDKAKAKFDEIKGEMESLRDSVTSSIQGFFSLQTEGNPFAGLDNMANKAVRFAKALGKLVKQGVNPSVIAMIAQAGPDVGLRAAEMLSTAGKANRNRINNAYERIDRAANRAGNIVSGAMYGDQLSTARSQLDELRQIRKAVTKHHKANPLANGWAAT